MKNPESRKESLSIENAAIHSLRQWLEEGNSLNETTDKGIPVEVSLNEEGEFLLNGKVVDEETDIIVAEVIVNVLTRIEGNIAKGEWSINELMGEE